MVDAASHGFGLFGPEFGYPGGGFCVSAFLFVRDGDRVLVGQMGEHPRWEAEWQPNLRYYSGDIRAKALAGLRFPGTYLRVGEHPADAAARVWRDQLGLPGAPALGAPRVISEAGPSRRYPGEQHWDIAFLYHVTGAPDAPVLGHWARLGYEPVQALPPEAFSMLHGELLPHVLQGAGANP